MYRVGPLDGVLLTMRILVLIHAKWVL